MCARLFAVVHNALTSFPSNAQSPGTFTFFSCPVVFDRSLSFFRIRSKLASTRELLSQTHPRVPRTCSTPHQHFQCVSTILCKRCPLTFFSPHFSPRKKMWPRQTPGLCSVLASFPTSQTFPSCTHARTKLHLCECASLPVRTTFFCYSDIFTCIFSFFKLRMKNALRIQSTRTLTFATGKWLARLPCCILFQNDFLFYRRGLLFLLMCDAL